MPLLTTISLSSVIEPIQAELPLLLKQARVPGLGLVLIRDGQIVWRKTVGVKQADTAEVLRAYPKTGKGVRLSRSSAANR